jgi:hypothetical protein
MESDIIAPAVRIMTAILLVLILLGAFPHPALAAACKPSKTGMALYLEYAPRKALSGEDFNITLGIVNNENISKQVVLYSYVYRGSKAYSISRRANNISLELGPEEYISLDLPNNAVAGSGGYKLKAILEYDTNKTREVTATINITTPHDYLPKRLTISHLGFEEKPSPRLIAVINNTFPEDQYANITLDSSYGFSAQELTIYANDYARLEFPISLGQPKNPFFLKIYQNSTLTDISEIILKNSSAEKPFQQPFALVDGDMILNTSSSAYMGSGEKSRSIVIYLLLGASIILNLAFIIRKKEI